MHPRPRHHHPARRPAFTLAELIVASVIVAFIVAATTVSLSQAIRARDAAGARAESTTRAAVAVDRIARDIENAVRDSVIEFTRIALTPAGAADARADSILIYSRSLRRVRPALVPGGAEPAEGGEYEVQYRLESPPTPSRTAGDAGLILWRRADPVPDDFPDGGGVAAPVTPGIRSLALQATDGNEWFDEWDSDYSGYPHAVRITVTASDDRARNTAVARRTVPLDRTPLPVEPPEEEPAEAEGSAAPGTTNTPASTPTAPR